MLLSNPTALLWAVLAVPIVVFYLLRVRLRQQHVATVMFWDQIFDQRRTWSLVRRLRHVLSLLMQLLFLALIVGALADPFFASDVSDARRVVLVIDNSASMNATDVEPNRLGRAKRHGLRLIRGLRPHDQMAVVSAASGVHVECGLTTDTRTLQRVLEAIPSTDGPTRVADAVHLARQLLAGDEAGEIVVATDGRFSNAAELQRAQDTTLVPCGTSADNVGITHLQVRRSLIDPAGYQILVEVTNFSATSVACRLEIELANELIDVVPLSLEPDARWRKAIDHVDLQGGQLIARLDVDDVLACDNQAVALLPRRERQPVLLITDGSIFLQTVLESIPLVDLTVTNQAPSEVASDTIVIYHQRTPEIIPQGRVMVVDPVRSCDLWTLGGPIADPVVTEQNRDSPLMTHVQLENVTLPQARQMEMRSEHLVLARAMGGQPLYAAFERPLGRVLVLSVNLHQGDLPLRTAFPIMMTNALAWYQGQRGEMREAIACGQLVRFDAPIRAASNSAADPAALSLRTPRGDLRPLPSDVARITAGPLDLCGVWRVESGNQRAGTYDSLPPVITQFACNLSNPEESDLRRGTWGSDVASSPVSLDGRPLWFYFVALAVVLTTIEWWLYQRRWIS